MMKLNVLPQRVVNTHPNLHILGKSKTKKPIQVVGVGLILISHMLISLEAVATNLVNIDYANEVQTKMAAAIDVICPQLAGIQGELTGNTQQLFFRCREMVQTADEIVTGENPGNSLGWDTEELGAAMNELADEEVGVQGDWATRISNEQLTNIQTRFSDLHAGTGGGISLNGLQLQSDEQFVNFGQLSTPATGGSAGDTFGPWGLFVNGAVSTGSRDATGRQAGFDLDSIGITTGLDYRFNDTLFAGAALGYTKAEADLDHDGGTQDVEGFTFIAYGSYYFEDLYVDGSLSYGVHDYDSERTIVYDSNTELPGVNSLTSGNTDGNQWNAFVATGFTIHQGKMDYTPYAQLRYVEVDIDGYQETGGANPELNMAVGDQSIDSLQSVLGGKAAYTTSTDWGVLIPYVRADWRHEFKNDSRALEFQYVFDPLNTLFTLNTDKPDVNFFAVGLGASAVYRAGQAFLDVEFPVGLRHVKNYVLTLGARFAF